MLNGQKEEWKKEKHSNGKIDQERERIDRQETRKERRRKERRQ